VGPGWTNWAVESFMDEAAEKAGVDPSPSACGCWTPAAQRRLAPNAVGGAKRQAAVLQRVATRAGWGKPLPKHRPGPGHHLRPGTRHADLDGLRRPRAGRPAQAR
jgi:hypothetical protein